MATQVPSKTSCGLGGGMYLYVVTVLLLMVMVNIVRLNYVKRTERDHDNARNN